MKYFQYVNPQSLIVSTLNFSSTIVSQDIKISDSLTLTLYQNLKFNVAMLSSFTIITPIFRASLVYLSNSIFKKMDITV